jgi:hypothetical protein
VADASVAAQQLQQDLEEFKPGELAPYEPPDDDAENYEPGEGEGEISEALQEELREICRHFSEQGRWTRRIEVQNRRRNRLYWAGIQRLGWNAKDMMFQIPFSGPTTANGSGSDAAKRPPVLDTTNIYQRDGRSIIAVLTQNTPNVRFFADDPKNDVDIRSATTSDKLRKVIERNNNMPDKRIDLGRLLWTDGRVVAFTRYVVDGQRYGKDEKGEPRGQEEIDWFGVLEARVPITCKSQHPMPYMDLSDEEDVVNLQCMYPKVACKIEPGSAAFGEDEYDRIARLSVRMSERMQVLAGDTYTHLATRKRAWIRPAAFASVTDQEKRKKLFQMFPKGCRVTFAGTAFCNARNESMDDHIEIVRPLPGDGQDTPALGDLEISIQDRVNDLADITMEAYYYALPTDYIDQKLVDIKALQEQESQFGAVVGVDTSNMAAGEAIGNKMFRMEGQVVGADMQHHLEELFGPIAQSLTGNLPSLFGGNMEDQKTAKGYAMAKAAAMGQMGVIWQRIKTFYAGVMLQAVQCAAIHRNEDTIILNEGDRETEISLADMKGKVKCYPVTDENFPDSPSEQRSTYMTLLAGAGQNPVLAQNLMHPDNQAMAKNLIGLPDLRIVGADIEEKALWDISQLLKSAPVPSVNPQTQQPVIGPDGKPAMESSMPIDPVFDDPATEFPIYKTWMNSPEARAIKITNPDGYANVKLKGTELNAAIQKAAQQAQQTQIQGQVAIETAKHPPKPAAQPHQGPSFSGKIEDQPPFVQSQLYAQAGIQAPPEALQAGQAVADAREVHKEVVSDALKPKPAPPKFPIQ